MSVGIVQSICNQKTKYVGWEGGPKSSENVSDIVDLAYVPGLGKQIVKKTILKTACDLGVYDGIIFLDHENMDNKNNFQKAQNCGLIIENQHFSDLSDRNELAKYFTCDAFPGIFFANCSFENIYLGGKVFGSYKFQNCTFNDFYVRKGTLSGFQFENCEITNFDMTRAVFYGTSFTNCTFLKLDLGASSFSRCKLKKQHFLTVI